MTRYFQNGVAAILAIVLCAASFGIVTSVPAQPGFAVSPTAALA